MWNDDEHDEDSRSGPRRSRPESRVDLPLRPEGAAEEPTPLDAELPSPAGSGGRRMVSLFPSWTASRGRSESAGPRDVANRAEDAPAERDEGRIGPGPRALSGGVDLVILACIAGVLVLVLDRFGSRPFERSSAIWVIAFALEFGLVGAILSVFLFGRTPGMALAELEACETDGLPVRFLRSGARVVVGLVGLVLPGLALLVSAVRDDGRSLTDLLTGTRLQRSSTDAAAS